MNVKKSLPPLNMNNSCINMYTGSPESNVSLNYQTSFFAISPMTMTKKNSICNKGSLDDTKTPLRISRLLTSSSPLLQLPKSCNKSPYAPNHQTNTTSQGSSSLQIISPYLCLSSQKNDSAQGKQVFSFKNVE